MTITVARIHDGAMAVTHRPGWLARLIGFRERNRQALRMIDIDGSVWVWDVTGREVDQRTRQAIDLHLAQRAKVLREQNFRFAYLVGRGMSIAAAAELSLTEE